MFVSPAVGFITWIDSWAVPVVDNALNTVDLCPWSAIHYSDCEHGCHVNWSDYLVRGVVSTDFTFVQVNGVRMPSNRDGAIHPCSQ